jgi:glycolate oxidase iron-sulfur subunit
MQTNFSPRQLADPRMAEAERILRTCVHCGFCTATCPTYVLLGDERDSPRGRIYLMKEMFERGKRPSAEVELHIDRCLSCLSCMTTCPSGVDYMHLVDRARAHIAENRRRSLVDKLLRATLAAVLPYPERLRAALRLARLVRPLRGVLRRLGMQRVLAMLELAPRGLVLPSATFAGPGTAATKGERRRRVILLAGCAQTVLRPEINDATIRLLAGRGVDVEVAPGAGCCGALVQHMGFEAAAIEMAKRNVDAWSRLIEKRGSIDALIVNTSGCGTTLKDYGHLLQREAGHAERAAKIAAMTRDVCEFLAGFALGPPRRWSSLRVAYQSPCSMQHGQRIIEEPRRLLRDAGFTVTEIPEAHLCCGSAGTYNILQPDLARELRARKVDNIRSVRPDVVATGNIGCMVQIAQGSDIPIAHSIELLDWAYGGPVPRGLEALARHVNDVPQPKPLIAVT